MRIFLAALVLVALAACGTQSSDTPAARSADEMTATPGGDPPDRPAIQVNFVGAEALTGETRSVLAELVERIHPAIVQVVAGSGGGSGFIVNPSGLLVTNSHVVDGFDSVEVILPDGSRYGGEVLARDDGRDLATVSIQGGGPFSALAVGDAAAMRLGDEVLALGYPSLVQGLGISLTVTRGIISAVRTVDGIDLLQTDAALNPGNSGGPLVKHGRRGDRRQHLESNADRERPACVGRWPCRLSVGIHRAAGRAGRRAHAGRAHCGADLDAGPDVDRSSHLDPRAHVGGSPNTDTTADMDTRPRRGRLSQRRHPSRRLLRRSRQRPSRHPLPCQRRHPSPRRR